MARIKAVCCAFTMNAWNRIYDCVYDGILECQGPLGCKSHKFISNGKLSHVNLHASGNLKSYRVYEGFRGN